MSACALLGLVTACGYVFLVGLVLLAAAGVPLPVTVVLVALGSSSGRPSGPSFPLLSVLGTAAATGGDLLDYGIGLVGARALPNWLLRACRRAARADDLKRNKRPLSTSGPAIFLSRFLFTALGPPVSILAGASKTRPTTFLVWDIGGEAIYVIGNLALGRWLGVTLSLRDPRSSLLLGVLAVVTAAPMIFHGCWRWARRRAANRLPAGTLAEPLQARSKRAA